MSKKNKVLEFIIDETLLIKEIGSSELVWLWWVAIEPWNRRIFWIWYIKGQKYMFMAEKFISDLIKSYNKHSSISIERWRHLVSSSGLSVSETEALHSFFLFGKSLIKRTMQYVKSRTEEGFDDDFPCRRKKYKLKHVKNWLKLFVVYYHNKEINLKWTEPIVILKSIYNDYYLINTLMDIIWWWIFKSSITLYLFDFVG